MNPTSEKRDAWARAKEHLASSNDEALRYAALELRRCMEAIVYEKLWAYRDRIPADVARRWQPPQAFKALLFFEPDAESTRTVRFAEEREYGVRPQGPFKELGTDQRFDAKWLTREYNRLGSLLHAAWPFARQGERNADATQPYLNELLVALERFVTTSFTSTLAEIISFSCSECDTIVKINAKAIANLNEVECLNCGAKYTPVHQGNDTYFNLVKSVLLCPECGSEIIFPEHKIEIGYARTCGSCSAEFRITRHEFGVERVRETPPAAPTSDA